MGSWYRNELHASADEATLLSLDAVLESPGSSLFIEGNGGVDAEAVLSAESYRLWSFASDGGAPDGYVARVAAAFPDAGLMLVYRQPELGVAGIVKYAGGKETGRDQYPWSPDHEESGVRVGDPLPEDY